MAKMWIAGALKHPGSLRKSLKAKKGEPISDAKLDAAAKKSGKIGRRARFAKLLKSFHKNQEMISNRSTTSEFISLRCNLGGAKIRHEMLEGKDYLVVPMVMITEGVHNGSSGPLYYPKSELNKTPVSWDHKPVVVYHPEANGQGVSACLPEVLNTRKVGLILNTNWDGKLKSEAWLDEARLKVVDNRVLEALEAGKMIEVSTGLFTDNEPTEGEWNSEKYVAIARNYRPDHLAILPDQVGSCSIDDGAGLLRNSGNFTHEHKRGLVQAALKDKHEGRFTYPEDMTDDRVFYRDPSDKLVHEGYEIDDKGAKATLKGDPKEVTKKTQYLSKDGKTIANVVSSLPSGAGKNKDVKDKRFVDRVDEDNPEEKDDRNEAPDVDEYDAAAEDSNEDQDKKARKITKVGPNKKVTKDQARFGKQAGITNMKGNTTMKKSEMIDALVGNSDGLWVEADKEFLDEQPIERLQVFLEANKELEQGSGDEENEGNNTDVDGDGKTKPKGKKKKLDLEEGIEGLSAKKPKKKAPPKKVSDSDDEEDDDMSDDDEGGQDDDGPAKNSEAALEQYIAEAPPSLRDMLQQGIRAHNVQRAKLVKVITSNKANRFTQNMLKAKPMDELQALAELAAPTKKPVANYGGLGWGESGAASFPSNVETPLELPTLDFSKK